jgi:hypothetical protein
MASGPDDYHYDPADDGDEDNIDEGYVYDEDDFFFPISEDMATDNRLVSGSTFPSAAQFARRKSGHRTAPGTATNPG